MRTLTKELQAALTPDQALMLLKEGNKRFINRLKINRDLLQHVNETSEEQYPFAVILSCIDSRAPVELIFDQGLGDIFSIRIAGNILNDDILGSMEFACNVAGSKLIAVLGHTKCGAIKGACDQTKLGNLTALLNKITPAVIEEKTVTSNRNSDNAEFMKKVTILNVKMVMQAIPARSAILQSMLEQKKIALAGGIYCVTTGKVEFFEDNSFSLEPTEAK